MSSSCGALPRSRWRFNRSGADGCALMRIRAPLASLAPRHSRESPPNFGYGAEHVGILPWIQRAARGSPIVMRASFLDPKSRNIFEWTRIFGWPASQRS